MNFEFANIKKLSQNGRDTIHNIPGVHGTGISFINGQYYILVYVESDGVADKIPEYVNNVPTKVVITKPFKMIESLSIKKLSNTDTVKYRPIRPGIAISPEPTIALFFTVIGTLGAIGYGPNNERIMISNNHILAAQYPINIGWLGHKIYQPALSCRENNTVGNLRGYIPVYNDVDNVIDAAWASIDPGIEIEETDPYGHVIGSSEEPVLNDEVSKYGIGSSYTEGTISAIDGTIKTINGTRFVDAIFMDMLASSGDSGAAVIRKLNNAAVGILYGVTADGTISVACKARNVEYMLGIKFGTTEPPPLISAKYSCASNGCYLDYTGIYDTIQECWNVCPTTEEPKQRLNLCQVYNIIYTSGFFGILGVFYLYSRHKK